MSSPLQNLVDVYTSNAFIVSSNCVGSRLSFDCFKNISFELLCNSHKTGCFFDLPYLWFLIWTGSYSFSLISFLLNFPDFLDSLLGSLFSLSSLLIHCDVSIGILRTYVLAHCRFRYVTSFFSTITTQ